MLDVDRAVGKAVSKIFLWSVRHAKLVVAVYLAITLVFAYGLKEIQVRSTDYDLMPDTHPSAEANYKALDKIPGFRNADTLWIEVSDAKAICDNQTGQCRPCSDGEQGCVRDNITSVRSVRAAQEAADFIQARVPEMKYVISLPYLAKLINYTLSGQPDPANALACAATTGDPPSSPLPVTLPPPPPPPSGAPPLCSESGAGPTNATARPPDEAAFALPADDTTLNRDMTILAAAAPDVIAAQTNEQYTGAIVVFIYDVNITKEGPEKVVPVATRFVHAAQEWRETGCTNMRAKNVLNNGPAFKCENTYILGQSINGHLTELAQSDFETFGPIVFVATFFVLVVAFTDISSMFIAFVSFCMGLVWTYGLMGYAHIPLTFFGLLIVPITMGVGKEYAIYVTNQYMEYVASGKSRDEVWSMVGRRAGAALAIASVTSIAGLLAMFLAGFHIMRDLAILTIFAFASLFFLSVMFIPAAQAMRRKQAKPKPFKPSLAMGAVARGISRNRTAVVVITVMLTGALLYESTKLKEYFGISGGFRQGDYLEESYKFYNSALGGSGTELVVLEGDIGDWKTLQYITDLDANIIKDKTHVPKASNVNSVMIGLRTYYDLRNGLTNPAILTEKAKSDPNANIPHDSAEIHRAIHYMYNTTVWAPLVAIFVSPEGDYAVTHFFYHIDREDFEGLQGDWDALNCDVGNVAQSSDACASQPNTAPERPSTIKSVNLVGTQDTFYLFVKFGLPWLDYVSYIAAGLTLLIAIAVLRRPRDVLAVMVPMVIAGIWWLGLLPLFGIQKSMTLMLPTVLLISVGSDYAIQYVWNYRELHDMEEVYRTTGKANLYVVVATIIAFLLFVPMKLVLSSQGALAAALAIGCIFTSTTLLVPLFYPGASKQASRVKVTQVRHEEPPAPRP